MTQKFLAAIKQPRIWLATALFIVMSVMLYAVQYPLFDGAFMTPFVYALIYGVVFFVTRLLRNEGTTRRKTHAAWRVVEWFLTVGVIAAVAWSVYNDRYFLLGYQCIALIVTLGAFLVRKRAMCLEKLSKYNSTQCSVMCAAAILSTALFFAVVRPVTVSGAEQMLKGEGYGDIMYVMHIVNDADRVFYAAFNMPDNLEIFDGAGAYLLRGERDGEAYGVFVNLTRREIARVIPLAENPAAKNAIDLIVE